jgi:hypothetical protein
MYVVVSPWDTDQHVHGEEEVKAAEEKVEIWNGQDPAERIRPVLLQ